MPLDVGVGDETWWSVVDLVVPVLADMFKPTFIVSQHGCDSHVLDPLAHLRLTTASYQRANEMIDGAGARTCTGALARHRRRRLRRIPGGAALVGPGVAGAGPPRGAVAHTPGTGASAGSDAAEAYGQAPLPVELVDSPRTVAPDPDVIVSRNLKRARAALVRSLELQAGC